MRKRILAGAALLALATGATTGAMASGHNGDRSGSHAGRVHAGPTHSVGTRRANRYAGVRGFESARHGGRERGNPYGHVGWVSLGPLGFTAGCGQRCGQGYSVSAWSY